MYKLTFILFVFVSSSLIDLSAQTFTNNGASLTIADGSSMTINGDFENINGSIDNSGDIYITGNWTNNATSGNLLQGTSGSATFNGASAQTIGGASQTWFNNIDLQSDASLAVTTSISGQLQLNNASLSLNNSHLLAENTASISGVNGSYYIIADGNGRLVREVGNANVYFPVGTSNSFVPVMLNNPGTVDNFAVRVFEDVLDGGSTGTTIPEIDNCVYISWDITEQINGGSDLSITPYWGNANEGSSFDRTMAGIGHYTSGNWDPQAAQNGSGPAPHSITRTGITALSTFAVGDINSPMAITLDLIVDLKAFLEGPFEGPGMGTVLNTNNQIPLSQPYNTSPWNYAGTENVVIVPNGNVVDWVLIELRDAANPGAATTATTIARQAAFLLKNGDVAGLDGSSVLQFPTASFSHNLNAVVWHRNHLGIMSANGLSESGGTYSYDFSTAITQVYNGGAGYKEIATNVYGMVGGDADADGEIGNADKTLWTNDAGTKGYKGTDHNMDVQVSNRDKNDTWAKNGAYSAQVPE